MKRTVIQEIASRIAGRLYCADHPDLACYVAHTDALTDIARNALPHGSGFDIGTEIDFERSTPERIVLETAFHHMDRHGVYCGWSQHNVIVTPSFDGICIRVTGRNRNDIKDYIADAFRTALESQDWLTVVRKPESDA